MNHEDLIFNLRYISEVKSRIAEESNEMTEKLNDVRENLAEIITENNSKQADIIDVLQEVQGKLQNFPKVVANEQSSLQTQMARVGLKIRKLNQSTIEQGEELSEPIEAINDYFEQFEEQLETMGERHLQILARGVGTFDELRSNLESQNRNIDIAWEATEQEIDILGQKINSFQNLVREQINSVEDELESARENINDEVEAVFEQELPELETRLTDNIQASLEQIREQVEQFADTNGASLEEYYSSLVVADKEFNHLIGDSFAPIDEQQQHVEEQHELLADGTEKIIIQSENLQASCDEMVETLKAIND